MIEIKNANDDQFSPSDIQQLYDIVIKGYELTEAEIWGLNYVRIFPEDYDKLIAEGSVLVATMKNQVVGGVYFYKIDPNTYGFGLLATDFNFKSKGIGATLIEAVEMIAKNNGANAVTIEILRVKGVDVPSKLILAEYYERLGYHYTHSEDCSCKIHSEKYKRLIAPSDFDFYTKKI